jgi:dihydroorotate dehydrogenase electron transfer subunit
VTAAAEPRTPAPPERRVAPVTANERIGAYSLITALDSAGPQDPRPGQFYMLAAAERWGGGADERWGGAGGRPYLPRAFSYARARPTEDGVELSFLLEAIGPGTERLAELEPGEGLALVGPLGIGFRPAEQECRPVLVGGGIGAAPILCLQDELIEADTAPPTLLGFRSADFAEAAGLFRGGVDLATDDGSAGRHALVTELLREQLEDVGGRAAVYACGPPPMLEAVRLLCASHRCPAQLAMESGMACGFGACFGCVVPTKSGYVRLCVDGPVVDADELETAMHP